MLMQTQRMLGIRMLIKTPSTASARQRLTGASLSGRQTSRLRTNFSFPVSCVKPAARPQQRHAYATESEHIEAAEDSDGDYVDDEELTFQEADDLDPEGRDATLEDFYTPRDGTPQALLDELYSDVVYGPPVRLSILIFGRKVRLTPIQGQQPVTMMAPSACTGCRAGRIQGGGVRNGEHVAQHPPQKKILMYMYSSASMC